jgi:hypothetical protein
VLSIAVCHHTPFYNVSLSPSCNSKNFQPRSVACALPTLLYPTLLKGNSGEERMSFQIRRGPNHSTLISKVTLCQLWDTRHKAMLHQHTSRLRSLGACLEALYSDELLCRL